MNHDPFADPFLPRLLIDERDMFSRNEQRGKHRPTNVNNRQKKHFVTDVNVLFLDSRLPPGPRARVCDN